MRYVATIEIYVHAEKEANAINEAEHIARDLDQQYDNKASVTAVHFPPQKGIGNSKKIYP